MLGLCASDQAGGVHGPRCGHHLGPGARPVGAGLRLLHHPRGRQGPCEALQPLPAAPGVRLRRTPQGALCVGTRGWVGTLWGPARHLPPKSRRPHPSLDSTATSRPPGLRSLPAALSSSPRAPSPPHPAPLAPSLWPAVLRSPRPRSAPSHQFPCLPGPSGQLRLGPSLAIRTPPRLSTQTPPSCHTCATHRHEHARAHMHSRMLHTCGHTTQTRNTHACSRACMHTRMCEHSHACTRTQTHLHVYTLACRHTCRQGHTCAHVLHVCR